MNTEQFGYYASVLAIYAGVTAALVLAVGIVVSLFSGWRLRIWRVK